MKKIYLLVFVLCCFSNPHRTFAHAELNSPHRSAVIRVFDNAPTITCIVGLSVNIMPNKKITLHAVDFVLYAEDHTTPGTLPKIGIRKKGTGMGFPVDTAGNTVERVTFDCTELGAQSVELWAMDATGSTAFCETTVLVQDNMGNCSPAPGFVQACAKTACAGPSDIYQITMEYNVTHPALPPTTYLTAACNGIVAPADAEVTITPFSNNDPLNGVSAMDVSLLEQSIQTGQPFASAYQWIAADANNDNVIDSLDVIECRNLLLGIYTELPNNSAWRFVDKSYTFPWPNPLSAPFPESITVHVGSPFTDPIEFVAVKICDINCSGFVGIFDPSPEMQHRIGIPQPNPTRGGAMLPVQLVRSETVRLDVLDLSGRLLFRSDTYLPAGPAMLEIPASALPARGMYVWRVLTGDVLQAGKVVRE